MLISPGTFGIVDLYSFFSYFTKNGPNNKQLNVYFVNIGRYHAAGRTQKMETNNNNNEKRVITNETIHLINPLVVSLLLRTKLLFAIVCPKNRIKKIFTRSKGQCLVVPL